MKMNLVTLLFVAVCLTGCATAPTDPIALAEFKAQNDPLEPMNRSILAFNDKANEYVLTPVAKGYRKITSADFRKGVRTFFGNLKTPLTIINDVLQLNIKQAGLDTSRFVINSTLGFFGVFDVADRMGIAPNQQGFGNTMGVWGIPSGPYLVIPFLGPSNVRDVSGLTADIFADPLYLTARNHHKDNIAEIYAGLGFLEIIAIYENAMDLMNDSRQNSLDYYVYVRTMYQQYRQRSIEKARGINLNKNKASYEFSIDDEDLE